MKIRGLSDRDEQTLATLVREWRARPHSTPAHTPPAGGISDAPQVYVARTPAAGIAAVAGSVLDGADCVVYQGVVNATSGDDELVVSDAVAVTVFNPYTIKVPGDTFVVVARDKFGYWYVTSVPPSDVCSSATVTESEVRCEDGLLKLYKRDVALTVSASTGCLTATPGSWVHVRSVGCCTDTCTGTATDGSRDWWCVASVGTGTGTASTATGTGTEVVKFWCLSDPGTATSTASTQTGTATGTPQFGWYCLNKAGTATATGTDPTPGTSSSTGSVQSDCASCGVGGSPGVWRLNVTLTDAGCTDSNCNRTINVDLVFLYKIGNVCYWGKDTGTPLTTAASNSWVGLTVDESGTAILSILVEGPPDFNQNPVSSITYYVGTWNCQSTNELTLSTGGCCSGPATVTLTPA